MSKISLDEIIQIREKADIVEIISSYIPLEAHGKNYFGVCPFHDDTSPSMSVSPEKKIYKCFSCGATGTVFKFIMDYEHVSFNEALKKVADICGINVDINIEKKKVNNKLYDIYDLAQKYYINNINTKDGIKAKKYLKERSIDANTVKEFQIGLSTSNQLSKVLVKKFEEKELLGSGLVTKNEYGYLDLFYNRIMFPLYDLSGQVVGYSARVYQEGEKPKYINTKETQIFKKGCLLYNYHRAKDEARVKNQIIVVEGFMDVIRAYTIGVKNVVATMGTAVTKNQAHLIKKLGKEVILCFDGDEAGAKATFACADELINIGVTPKVIRLGDLDPDEYILKNGKDSFLAHINKPISIMDFKLSYIKNNKNLNSNEEFASYINEAIKEINKIDDEVLREITIKKLIEESGLKEDVIRNKIVIKKPKIYKKPTIKYNKYEIAQRNLIFYMLKSIEAIKVYDDKITYMPDKEYRFIGRAINDFYQQKGYIDEADFIDYIECDEDVLNTIAKVNVAGLKEDFTKEEIEDYVGVIREYNVKNEVLRLKEKIAKEIDPVKKALIAQKIVDLKKEEV